MGRDLAANGRKWTQIAGNPQITQITQMERIDPRRKRMGKSGALWSALTWQRFRIPRRVQPRRGGRPPQQRALPAALSYSAPGPGLSLSGAADPAALSYSRTATSRI